MPEPTASRMSNVFPPMISATPPPIDNQAEEDEEDFGDFRVADLTTNSPESSSKSETPPCKEPSAFETFQTISQYEANTSSSLNIEPPPLSTLPSEVLLNHLNSRQSSPTDSEDQPVINSLEAGEEHKDLTQELEDIPFDLEIGFPSSELRRSPEGAASDSNDVSESSGLDFRSDIPCFEEDLKLDNINPSQEIQRSSNEDEPLEENSYCEQSINGVTNDNTIIEDRILTCQEEEEPSEEDDFCDFADFSSHDLQAEPPPLLEMRISQSVDSVPSETIAESQTNVNDDFNDLAPSELNVSCSSPLPVSQMNDEDDFDDFEFAAAAPPPVNVSSLLTQEPLIQKDVADIFPYEPLDVPEDPSLEGCLHSCLDDSSSAWGHLKDLETSHALTFLWANSSTSKKLLCSLNIDSRNIFVGSRYNSSLPRFAANMSCAPLEPLKAESVSVTPSLPSRISPPGSEDVVPAAQFDWNSSGLTNPLDCVEKEETKSGGRPTVLMKPEMSSTEPLADLWGPDVSPLAEQSISEPWASSELPSTDVLLPSPVTSSLTVLGAATTSTTDIPEERNIPATLSIEDWLGDVSKTKEDSPIENSNSETVDVSETWTISSQLEVMKHSKEAAAVGENTKLSAEACRVVEALPDLSFLSARKLLFAANESLSRFHTANH